MTETITLPEAWVEKGVNLRVTIYIENGVLKRTVTDRRFTGKELSKSAKLTYAQADEIRRRFKDGETKASLAREFKVSPRTVGRVINLERYV